MIKFTKKTVVFTCNRIRLNFRITLNRAAEKPGNLEKPGIWQLRQKKKTGKTWNLRDFEKNLEFWTNIFKKPGILNQFLYVYK